MASGFRFALIGTGDQFVACADLLLAHGHQVVGVVSECPQVTAWCTDHGVERYGHPGTDAWPADRTFDYLLSIVNHQLLGPETLATADRAAINFHDALLPDFGGLNATAWSILDGRTTHGVTWHEMTAKTDRGPVYVQKSFDIADDDTAFSLSVKCSEAGVASFEMLLTQIEWNALEPKEQEGEGSFHVRSDRPGQAILDFSRPASELHRVIRGLHFGSFDNWMTTPKIRTPDGVVAVLHGRADLDSSDAIQSHEPGTVLSVTDDGITMATGEGSLTLTEVATLDGEPIGCVAAASLLGLVAGRVLPAPDPDLLAQVETFDRDVTRSERFWVRRVAEPRPAALPDFDPAAPVDTEAGGTGSAAVGDKRKEAGASGESGRVGTLRRSWPEVLNARPPESRARVAIAALASTLHRLSGEETLDMAAAASIPSELATYFAEVTPFRCRFDEDGATFESLIRQVGDEISARATRGTYARDVALRYPEAGLGGEKIEPLPIGVCYETTSEPASLVAGTALTLVAGGGDGFAWVYDERVHTPEQVEDLARRVEVLMAAGLATPDTPLDSLPVLLPLERKALLETWQDTAAPFESERCVHEFFERQVEATPEAPAVTFGSRSLSYRELNERANQLAHELRAGGVGAEVLVAICVERSLDMVIGLLGILKAGGAYVPMDPAYPRDRLALMLEDSRAAHLVVQRRLLDLLPDSDARVVVVDELPSEVDPDVAANPQAGVRSSDLAYAIFTSGSTGRPKGTLLEHRQVANFFAGMDAVIEPDEPTPGVWLAVTSISFDISVLELFWTLGRGFEVVIAPETDRASIERRNARRALAERARARRANPGPMEFGLFYFAADAGATSGNSAAPGGAYRLLLEGARFADTHGFKAVWTPERHFHAFGGLYPNPSVTTAALATITERIHLRSGSVVLPLHNPLRVAEDWAVIDQLSGGRVGLGFASGWHVNDFTFKPENYERRREVMLDHIATVEKLWRGEKVEVLNGAGEPIEVSVLPRPIQSMPPIWLTAAGSPDTFVLAGRLGANVLTHMLGQDLDELRMKLEAYREARREHGHEGPGTVSVMLHTFVCDDTETARRVARKPFSDYLASSFDLVKLAPKMFPAFRQPSRHADETDQLDTSAFTAEDMAALLDHAFDRYFDTAGLFGTPEHAIEMVDSLLDVGATELACLIDFGIDSDTVLENLPHLHRLQELGRERAQAVIDEPVPVAWPDETVDDDVASLIRRHGVTHLQCTPSVARVLAADPDSLAELGGLQRLLVGGEALPPDLANELATSVSGTVLNMYGPTETTIWSTTSVVKPHEPPTIGTPIANTSIRILDQHGQPAPIGMPGELCIGGLGVARGYLDRPELTAERFVPDPCEPDLRIYRTGDLARYRADGEIEFLGRIDHQVKIAGHRIELGEIEVTIDGHPQVHQSVVVAREADGTRELVAYVVPETSDRVAGDGAEHVRHWQDLWDRTYEGSGEGTEPVNPRFRILGWNESYGGQAISADEMGEWLDNTVSRLRELAPKRVLEVGCGTGLVLYRLLEEVDHYTGSDISSVALQSIRQELSATEAEKVELLQSAAHELDHLADRSFDLVIVNSVAQYFPDVGYLAGVLRRATDLVEDGGHIFVGDVRSLTHARWFHTSVAMQQASSILSTADLLRAVDERQSRDTELLLAEPFFHALADQAPRLTGVDIQVKRGRTRNEMTRFRYDALLHVGGDGAVETGPPTGTASQLEEIRALLADGPQRLHLTDVPNARLTGLRAVLDALENGSRAPKDVAGLRDLKKREGERGVDPDLLYTLDPDYRVDVRWSSSGDPATVDVVFRRRGADAAPAYPPLPHSGVLTDYASVPSRCVDESDLVSQLRATLRARVPDHMVPAAFVVIDTMPLTPNGKIDRKALPDPRSHASASDVPYAAPTSGLEAQIGEVWMDLLGLDRVGRHDNIFDLGANSLLMMQANSRVSSLLGRKVSLVSMFRFPTVAALAEHLAEHLDEDAAEAQTAAAKRQADERASRSEEAARRRRALREERDSR